MTTTTKSLTFDTRDDQRLLTWINAQRGKTGQSFSPFIRSVLYAAMEADREGDRAPPPIPTGLDAQTIRDAVRVELVNYFTQHPISVAVPPLVNPPEDEKPPSGDTVDAGLRDALLNMV